MARLRNCFVVAVVVLGPILTERHAAPQARPNLARERVAYTTLKATARPQGELKEKIEALDREIAEAGRLGRTGELRWLLAKGMTLLGGREWTEELDFQTSLVVRSETVFVDSSRPYAVRLEQVYAPRVEVAGSLQARASAHRVARVGRRLGAGEKLRDLARADGLGRDLGDEPARLDLDLAGIEDGPCVIQIEVASKDRTLGAALLRIEVVSGLEARMARIETALAKLSKAEPYRADVLYPIDYIRNCNRGTFEIGTFQARRELELAEATLETVRAGRDPFARRTGDFERHYLLGDPGEIVPYRVYVPTRHTPEQSLPLVIALHGLGGNEDSFFEGYEGLLPKLAEERGYLVAAPSGYRVDGGYGFGLFRAPDDAAAVRKSNYSEKDVLEVVERMKMHYRVDPDRVYLTGHSMGAIGTWYLGAKYPDLWAALAPFAGFGIPDSLSKIRHVAEIVVHGDADPTVPVAGSRAMVARMKALGIEHRYIEVPGGNHVDIVAPNLSAIFDFFDSHRRRSAPASQ
jgi:poly(3-hydroxybutyrate) depolymerase